MKDFTRFNLAELEQLVLNYSRKNLIGTEDYAALLRAREAKLAASSEPDVFKSLTLLKAKARAQSYVSYGELALASGIAWNHTLRARMSGPKGHLDRLLDLCQSQQLPLLTAICVNKENLANGRLEDGALAGFVAGARRIGRDVPDEPAFLERCQAECFQWGREQNRTARQLNDDADRTP